MKQAGRFVSFLREKVFTFGADCAIMVVMFLFADGREAERNAIPPKRRHRFVRFRLAGATAIGRRERSVWIWEGMRDGLSKHDFGADARREGVGDP